MSKFTPGPWKSQQFKDEIRICTKSETICFVPDGYRSNIAHNANANLIMLSPEMYDLLSAYAMAAELGLITDLKKMGEQFRAVINKIDSI